jgi:hypothetical protein
MAPSKERQRHKHHHQDAYGDYESRMGFVRHRDGCTGNLSQLDALIPRTAYAASVTNRSQPSTIAPHAIEKKKYGVSRLMRVGLPRRAKVHAQTRWDPCTFKRRRDCEKGDPNGDGWRD